MVRAGFERDVDGGPARSIGGLGQRMDFGVRCTSTLMPAFADDLALLDDDAANAWIGCGGIQPPRRELQRVRHMDVIGCGVGVGTQGG